MEAVQKHLPMITIKQFGRSCFIEKEPLAKDIEAAQKGLGEVTEILKSKKYDVIVLDEATIAVYFKLFTISDLLKALKGRCEESEVVITGRYAPEELLREADLVTEMKEVKHYYQNGVEAREGIEY